MLLFNAAVAIRFSGQKMPNPIALGIGNLIVLLVVNVRLGQRKKDQSQKQDFEGDGGRQRT